MKSNIRERAGATQEQIANPQLPAITPIFDIGGAWAYEGVQGPIIKVAGNSFTVDMSAYHRPNAHGSFLSNSVIQVTFPDDKTYSGYLQSPTFPPVSCTIYWKENQSSWTQLTRPVPNVYRMSIAANASPNAEIVLFNAGFVAATSPQNVSKGVVDTQDPDPGELLALGGKVELTITAVAR